MLALATALVLALGALHVTPPAVRPALLRSARSMPQRIACAQSDDSDVSTCGALHAQCAIGADGHSGLSGTSLTTVSSCAPDDGSKGRRWRRRLRKGATLAAAALVVTPRSPATAVEPAAQPVSLSRRADSSVAGRQPLDAAFLGFRRKKTLEAPLPPLDPSATGVIDMDKIVGKKVAKSYTERDFIFDDALTAKSELQEELEEFQEFKESTAGQRVVLALATTGGAVGAVYAGTRALMGIEKWMKKQELLDIQAEQELTGQYISVDASDVETVFDPSSGKNLTISRPNKKKGENETAAPGPVDAVVEEPKQAPWLLRVLGLGAVEEADSDDFWAKSVAPSQKEGDDSSNGGAGGGSPAVDGGNTTSPTGSGGKGGGGSGGGDGLDDDSSGVDTLDDLLK